MLILTRNIGRDDTIVINGNTRVKVLAVNGKQVRLGIEAPREVSVDREEIHERKLASLRVQKSNAVVVEASNGNVVTNFFKEKLKK